MKINHRHLILLIFALSTITVSLLCYFFLYRQTTIQASNYLNSIKDVEVEKNSVDYEQKLIETFHAYEAEKEKINDYVLKEDNLVEFIESVENVGNITKTDLSLSSIASSENKIKTKIIASGSWENVMTALMLIENLPLSVSVSNVRLDNSGEREVIINQKPVKISEWRLALDIEALTTK